MRKEKEIEEEETREREGRKEERTEDSTFNSIILLGSSIAFDIFIIFVIEVIRNIVFLI